MKEITQQILTGERALYDTHDAKISYCTFENGESPLKESSNLEIDNCLFKWKYPFWYTDNVKVTRSAFFDMARAGIWYVNDFTREDTIVEAPKNFRRVDGLVLKNVNIPNAAETLWNCRNVKMEKVTACGDYFAMNSTDMEIDGLVLDGNYSFDGGRNIVVRNSRLLSKDAFWNAENITVYDSFISGEYLGWNSRNVRFVNCTIESLQGMCYMDNVVLEKCILINTNLAFEYSTVKADVTNTIDSIKNPVSGIVKAGRIMEVIFDDPEIEPSKTTIIHE